MFGKEFFSIGVVHLLPLFLEGEEVSLAEVEERAVNDALALAEAGFDGIIVENFGDAPFFPEEVPPHTISAMTRICLKIRDALASAGTEPLMGINVLRNDARAALAIAAAVSGQFIRVNIYSGAMLTDQGVIEGKAHLVYRYRNRICPNCKIFADFRVKHAVPLAPRPLTGEALELLERARADGIIVTGEATKEPVDIELLKTLSRTIPREKILVGSGVTPEQLPQIVPLAGGVIVGSWLKVGSQTTNPVDPEKARKFIEELRSLLEG